MSKQRLPVGKECWCPAELILARRKEQNVEMGRREGGHEKMAKEGLRVWTKKQKLKTLLEKKIYSSSLASLTFTCSLWL